MNDIDYHYLPLSTTCSAHGSMLQYVAVRSLGISELIIFLR